LLGVMLAVLIVVIRRQVKKLQKAQRMITEVHKAQQLVNEKLEEANKIKEEYIGYFFSLDSEFFVKLERLKRTLEQKLADRKFEDIRFIVNNIQLKKEKEELLRYRLSAYFSSFRGAIQFPFQGGGPGPVERK
jgi:hypothetical protein